MTTLASQHTAPDLRSHAADDFPTRPAQTSLAARINPVTKLAASLIIAAALLVTIDWVSAATALVLELALLPWAGLALKRLLRVTLPLAIAAVTGGISTVLYGKTSGQIHLEWWFVTVSEGSLDLGLATALRVLAIGLPGVVLFATTDPTDLADGLAQVLKLPSRFVLGGLAGLRLIGLFIDDWRYLGLARRARGVADAGGPIAKLKRFLGQAFALLVLSIRRGTKLATAMEAKGFGAPVERSWARPSRLSGRDGALAVIALAIAGIATVTALQTGTWLFVWGGN